MSYNKNAKMVNPAAILSGSAHLEAVRGVGSWGAGWVFGSGGLTNDVKVLSDTFKYLSTSGSYATDAELSNASGTLRTYAAGLSGFFQSGNISIKKADAAVSGIYFKDSVTSTGVYKISFHPTIQVATGVGGGSGYLWIEAV